MPPAEPSQKLKLAVAITASAAAVVLLCLFTYGLIHLSNVGDRVDANQRSTIMALCALRDDLKRRVDSGNQFLAAHPSGFAGISPATIRTSIDGQQRTIKALSPIACPAAKRRPARRAR